MYIFLHLLIIIGTPCVAILFVYTGIPLSLKKLLWGNEAHKHRLKPLDCELCLAFWFGIICSVFLETELPFWIYRYVIAILTGAASSVLAIYITKKLNE